jgi:hypothetical protein
MKTPVIDPKYLPSDLPLTTTLIWFLILDQPKTSPTAAVVGTILLGVLWAVRIAAIYGQQFVKPLDID